MKVPYRTLINWIVTKDQLNEAKEEEADLRRHICDTYFDGKEGQFMVKDEDKVFKLKANSKTTLKLEQLPNHSDETLREIADLQNRLKNLMFGELTEEEAGMITIKFGLSSKARSLPDDSVLCQHITESPAMPTLSVEYVD